MKQFLKAEIVSSPSLLKPCSQYDAGMSVLDADDERASASHCEHVSVRDVRTTLGEHPRRWNREKFYSSVLAGSNPASDSITCSVSTNRKSVTGRIRAILFFHMASIMDSSIEVFIHD